MFVHAVRGATTVENNNAEEMLNATEELLHAVVEANDIKTEDIISVIFTVTDDLNAVFPAAAARRLGWTSTALMCMKEIDVPGSLQKCIRIMMHFSTEKSNLEIRHIYQKGAKVLRPDL